MRSGWRMVAFGLPLALLTGCNRRQPNATPPAAAQAPSRPAWQMAELVPPMPTLPPYVNQPVMLDTTVPPEPVPSKEEAHPKRPKRHLKTTEPPQQETQKPATQPATPAETEEAANNSQPSESSPIGQLSTASGDKNTADRQTLLEKINTTENTLNGIHRPLSSDEQKTAALIRTFITRARDALKTDDFNGATNYYTRAHILLEELTKP
jgi:hypothetical protein